LKETMTTFADLNLSQPLLKALHHEGYETPTPIQARAIPDLLKGRDLLGIAQTGTGKTAAFALPILEHLSKKTERPARNTCRVLVLSPTRELASQIGESFKAYGRHVRASRAIIFGGVSINNQIAIVNGGVDVVVATPGRLCDLMERKALSLSKVEILVLDEVDQMLDLGFIHDIRRITAALPKDRQNLFFSATMPKEIASLANNLLKDPVRVEVAPVATTAERVNQAVIHVEQVNKLKVLADLLKDNAMTRTLVFTRTKHGADKVMKGLSQAGYTAAAIHGNKSQNNRERALAGFKAGKILVLVATDIAARGIDVDSVSHVINYDLPHVPESYVHRIGRTARAGAEGDAIALCNPEERSLLRDIERTIRQSVPVREHALGIKGVKELAPAHGWNPVGGRGGKSIPPTHSRPDQRRQGKPNSGRPQAGKPHGQAKPNGPAKPHHRGQGPRPQVVDSATGEGSRPAHQQHARPNEGHQGKPAHRDHGTPKGGFKGGNRKPGGKPSWMKELSGGDKAPTRPVRFGGQN
jgi:ATP-dependent RNA helicase RhlE